MCCRLASRQRLVHSFATSLRGPARPLTFAGAPLRAVIPIPNATGNVPLTFAALSYARTPRLTVLSDPAPVPDVEMVTAAMRHEPSSASRQTGDIDGEPPRAQNTPVCTGT
jgi:hypothetical protein